LRCLTMPLAQHNICITRDCFLLPLQNISGQFISV
jgi:hypothetical protein